MLRNIESHKKCFCYKDGGDVAVKRMEYPQGKTGTVYILKPEILFVLNGGISINMEHADVGKVLKKDEFVFLPAGTKLSYSIPKNGVILLVRLIVDFPECHVLRLNKITEHIDNTPPPGIYTLKVNSRIKHFLEGVGTSIDDGFRCRLYLQSEVSRMLFLIHAYYSKEDREKFFSHILTSDMRFSEFVRTNHMKYRTVSELADALCMTSQSFAIRFKKVFGTTPHKWMQQEKARQIYMDICRSNMSFKEIAIKYEFPLSSNFFRFCKQVFGESPGSIRKNLQKNIITR